MFDKIKATLKAAEATGIVTKALRLPFPALPYDPNDLGKRLVSHICEVRPDIFGFGRSKPPHPVATAAIALAIGLTGQYELLVLARRMIFLALGNVLLDASHNQYRYDFDDRERELIGMAQADYMQFDEQNFPLAQPTAELKAGVAPIDVKETFDERLARLNLDLDTLERKRRGAK